MFVSHFYFVPFQARTDRLNHLFVELKTLHFFNVQISMQNMVALDDIVLRDELEVQVSVPYNMGVDSFNSKKLSQKAPNVQDT